MKHLVVRCLFALTVTAGVVACTSPEDREAAIARQACSSCHQFPEPALLDQATWTKHVLPQMAFRMGFENMNMLMAMDEDERQALMPLLPAEPMVSEEDWERIVSYYTRMAPQQLRDTVALYDTLRQFQARPIRLPLPHVPVNTVVRHDPAQPLLYVGTRFGEWVSLHPDFTQADTLRLPSTPADVSFGQAGMLLTLMGAMDPNDRAEGQLMHLRDHTLYPWLDSLQRPVHSQHVDLNQDGVLDDVVCAFGNHTGVLLVAERRASGQPILHRLLPMPGARRALVHDFDHNGLPDLVALMTQADERVVLLLNQGGFRFRQVTLLRFPPVYGSSDIAMADMNGDGHEDLIYTNGDNADYSTVLKPYHGIRIFLNDGQLHFREHFFHPLHGATQTIARDFDQDGDVDLATIAFFPDFRQHPEQGFIYLENKGQTWKAYTTPLAARGRWMTMDVWDHDSDGDDDLVLAALAFTTQVPQALQQQWYEQQTDLLVLTNTLR